MRPKALLSATTVRVHGLVLTRRPSDTSSVKQKPPARSPRRRTPWPDRPEQRATLLAVAALVVVIVVVSVALSLGSSTSTPSTTTLRKSTAPSTTTTLKSQATVLSAAQTASLSVAQWALNDTSSPSAPVTRHQIALAAAPDRGALVVADNLGGIKDHPHVVKFVWHLGGSPLIQCVRLPKNRHGHPVLVSCPDATRPTTSTTTKK